MNDPGFADAEHRLESLEVRAEMLRARAEMLRARVESYGGAPAGLYVLALEVGDFEFLIEPRLLWGPPRVLVRRGGRLAEVWLDESDVAFTSRHPSRLSRFEKRRVLGMVEGHFDELCDVWFAVREDARRGRLERHVLVD